MKLIEDPVFYTAFRERYRARKANLTVKVRKASVKASINVGKRGSFYGRKHTEETKRKIGEANREKLKGENNGAWGTCWITLNGENRRVHKEELTDYIKMGWDYGRVMSQQIK